MITYKGVRVWPHQVQDKYQVQVPAGDDPGELREVFALQGVRTHALALGVTALTRARLGAGVRLLRVAGW